MAWVMNHRRSYDAVAERYAAEIGSELDGKPLDRALLETVAELAGQGPVGDIGCGPGHVAAYLSKRGVSTIGVDLSPGMCLVALEHANLPTAAGDMGCLPLASSTLAAIVCMYAVIHLDAAQRDAVYSEFARVLRPGGHAMVAFHVHDDEISAGGAKTMTEWWGQEVDVVFRFLDPSVELAALTTAGLEFVARLDRQPYAGVEHPSHRSYLLVRRPH
jgi:SAM-dependent methyltransferase